MFCSQYHISGIAVSYLLDYRFLWTGIFNEADFPAGMMISILPERWFPHVGQVRETTPEYSVGDILQILRLKPQEINVVSPHIPRDTPQKIPFIPSFYSALPRILALFEIAQHIEISTKSSKEKDFRNWPKVLKNGADGGIRFSWSQWLQAPQGLGSWFLFRFCKNPLIVKSDCIQYHYILTTITSYVLFTCITYPKLKKLLIHPLIIRDEFLPLFVNSHIIILIIICSVLFPASPESDPAEHTLHPFPLA